MGEKGILWHPYGWSWISRQTLVGIPDKNGMTWPKWCTKLSTLVPFLCGKALLMLLAPNCWNNVMIHYYNHTKVELYKTYKVKLCTKLKTLVPFEKTILTVDSQYYLNLVQFSSVYLLKPLYSYMHTNRQYRSV